MLAADIGGRDGTGLTAWFVDFSAYVGAIVFTATKGMIHSNRMVLLIVISMVFFENSPTVQVIFGILIGLAGCFWYSAFKLGLTVPKPKTEAVTDEKTKLVKP